MSSPLPLDLFFREMLMFMTAILMLIQFTEILQTLLLPCAGNASPGAQDREFIIRLYLLISWYTLSSIKCVNGFNVRSVHQSLR